MRSLTSHLAMIAALTALATAVSGWLLYHWLSPAPAAASAAMLGAGIGATLAWRALTPLRTLFRALAGNVASFQDGDFNFSIRANRYRDVRELIDAHNALADVLRGQRQALAQRELLLDTIVQNTPVATLLIDSNGRVVHANLAARRLFRQGRELEGRALQTLIDALPAGLAAALRHDVDGLVPAAQADDADIYHLTHRRFRLNGRRHQLILLRRMTAELRRQEVNTWKKVIRVISHELNNALAPIASLAHSGTLLLRQGQLQRLPTALATIEERARHLERFIGDYARFAKLPMPRVQTLCWGEVLTKLREQVRFICDDAPIGQLRADPAQLQQALLNLLGNAHESGSAADQIHLRVRRVARHWRIDVLDRGNGMNEAVLAQALLPFYSTKRDGTGLGLALAREIAEAHGGRIALLNRKRGGLCVSLWLPA